MAVTVSNNFTSNNPDFRVKTTASDEGSIQHIIVDSGSVTPVGAGTATLSNVAGAVSSTTLLAENTARLGAMIYNDSSAVLYVKFGDTASSSSFTVKMVADAYYEVPFSYTGIITGIWASATGAARITEVTA